MKKLNQKIKNYFNGGGALRVLFTGFAFDGYHGSVMHICEIAKYLKSLGVDVYIASLQVEKRFIKYLNEFGIRLYYLPELPLDIKYNIVWSYHFPFLPYLIQKGLKYDRIVCGCLSGMMVPLETPNILMKDNNIPIFVNAEETKVNLEKEYPYLKDRLSVLVNLAPDEFLEYKKENLSNKPKKLAIVSNHVPKELVDSIPIFKRSNINVDIFGENNNVLITPQILQNYDVIITIGKTVQYALIMGIPVYNYDYIGGIGYINLENIDKEEFYNFSGRSCCRQISPDTLVKEIVENYDETKKQMVQIQKIAERRYLLSANIDKLLLQILNSELTELIFNDDSKLSLIHESTLIDNYIFQRNDYLTSINLYKNKLGFKLLQLDYYILKILSKLIFWNKDLSNLRDKYKRIIRKVRKSF